MWAECSKAFREMHVLTVTISINTVKNTSNLIFRWQFGLMDREIHPRKPKGHLPTYERSALVIPEQRTALPIPEIIEPTAGVVSPQVRPGISFRP